VIEEIRLMQKDSPGSCSIYIKYRKSHFRLVSCCLCWFVMVSFHLLETLHNKGTVVYHAVAWVTYSTASVSRLRLL